MLYVHLNMLHGSSTPGKRLTGRLEAKDLIVWIIREHCRLNSLGFMFMLRAIRSVSRDIGSLSYSLCLSLIIFLYCSWDKLDAGGSVICFEVLTRKASPAFNDVALQWMMMCSSSMCLVFVLLFRPDFVIFPSVLLIWVCCLDRVYSIYLHNIQCVITYIHQYIEVYIEVK